ncbi:MAG: hypothetical protein JST35_03875 [Armatimonadetes bacterium]|nr:hypothetical protein [Armatimonadota bacterium]
MEQILPVELAELLKSENPPTVIDVREPDEYEICRIEGSILIPLGEIGSRLDELDPEGDYVMQCHHGRRSQMAGEVLLSNGFTRVRNLATGIDGWSMTVDANVRRY